MESPVSLATTYQNYEHSWWTPKPWLSWVDETFLGREWFDPCPQDWAPGTHSSGLERRWGDRTYCNHPGDRGSTHQWWGKGVDEVSRGGIDLIWCAFNVEQIRHMKPSPLRLPGWMVWPRDRIGFIWGGPDIVVNEKAVARGADPKWRRHGEICKSPGNWTVFFSTLEPAPTPSPSLIVRTGV